MGTALVTEQSDIFQATALATRRQQRLAIALAIGTLVAFLALVPFVRVPLMRMPAFIPSYEAALLFIDMITAIMLFHQFARLRLASVLVLASGYLFDALIIIPHALTFPGAFSPTGLLGAQAQTTAWLYVFWHGGFPLFVLTYALLRKSELAGHRTWIVTNVARATAVAIACVALLTIGFTLLATLGHDSLPVVMQGGNYSMLVTKGISPAVWLLTLMAMGALWQRKQHAVDLWLILVMWIWLFDIALSAVIGSSRYDLGFYSGRIFGLIAASFLLITLIVEMARMYAGALGTVARVQKQLAELGRTQTYGESKPFRDDRPDSFIHRQNIAHYRTLLSSDKLDDGRRAAIERLLAEEEAKIAGAISQS